VVVQPPLFGSYGIAVNPSAQTGISAVGSIYGGIFSGEGKNTTVYGVVGDTAFNGDPEAGDTLPEAIGGSFRGTSATANYSVQLQDGTEGAGKILVSQTSDGKANWSTRLSGSYVITGSLNVTAGITGSLQGTVTSPNRTAFRVYGPGGAVSATTQMSGSKLTLDYQQGSAFDISTGLFTAPIAGLYQITLVCRTNANNNAGINQVIIYKTSGVTQTTEIMLEWGINTSANHIGGASIARLSVGDTLKFVVAAGTISFDANDNWSVAYIG
jgi:hypothetical protein